LTGRGRKKSGYIELLSGRQQRLSPSLSFLTHKKGDLGAIPTPAATPLALPTSGRLLGVGGRWEPQSRRPVSSLVSRFRLLVLLGLGLGLHPMPNGAKMEVGCTTLWCDVVVGAALVTLALPINLASSFPILRRTDLGAGRAVMRYNREVVLTPSLTVPVSTSPPDLDVRHVGVVFLPEC
jgi:hypothetical protein